MRSRPRPHCANTWGFTLLEVLLAASILAVIVVVLVGSLRLGLRAWEAGERRAAAQQEVRAIVELVTEALADAYPYRGQLGEGPERVVLFQGAPDQVRFVTTAPPLVLDAPAVPFHAVTFARDGADQLRMVERLVPAEAPFEGGANAILSRSVTALRLQYRDEKGLWQDDWDGKTAAALPTAVRVELTIRSDTRSEAVGPLVVSIALGKRAA